MNDMSTLPTSYPKELRPYAGRILDLDSHEMMPIQMWVDEFGPEAQPMVDYLAVHAESEKESINTFNIPGFAGDVAPIGEDILDVKGARAPAAVSPKRRLDVMDVMGVSRQLFYPSGLVLLGSALYKAADNPNFLAQFTGNRRETVKRWFNLYNEWLKSVNSPRIRACALLFGDTPEELIKRLDEHLKAGFKAVFYLPASEAPGGRSPAHPDLDPLWARMAEANCTFTLHLEAAASMDTVWQQAPAFEGFHSTGEFNRNPAYLASVHLPFENLLAIMLIGGVFDRHPNLRMGVIEVGSHWVGPMIRRLDMWHSLEGKFARAGSVTERKTYSLPNPPSYYLKRNVRVTPFPFENARRDIEQFDLGEVLCFSTDYPHVEGGRNAFKTFYNNISPLGEKAVEDFFINNAMWLLPE